MIITTVPSKNKPTIIWFYYLQKSQISILNIMTGSMRHGAKKDHQGDSGRAGYGPRDGGGGARKKMDTSAGTLCVVASYPPLIQFVLSLHFNNTQIYIPSQRALGRHRHPVYRFYFLVVPVCILECALIVAPYRTLPILETEINLFQRQWTMPSLFHHMLWHPPVIKLINVPVWFAEDAIVAAVDALVAAGDMAGLQALGKFESFHFQRFFIFFWCFSLDVLSSQS